MGHEQTVSQIANNLGESRFRVEWVVRARQVKPSRKVGNARLYSAEAVEAIRAEIERLNARRRGVKA